VQEEEEVYGGKGEACGGSLSLVRRWVSKDVGSSSITT